MSAAKPPISQTTWTMIGLSALWIVFFWVLIWSLQHPFNQNWGKELIHDTHHKVRIESATAWHDGISLIYLKTPRGPEVAYLIAHGKYLAIGPLMDLKTGKDLTPILEKKYAS